jgi:hypothetical protein
VRDTLLCWQTFSLSRFRAPAQQGPHTLHGVACACACVRHGVSTGCKICMYTCAFPVRVRGTNFAWRYSMGHHAMCVCVRARRLRCLSHRAAAAATAACLSRCRRRHCRGAPAARLRLRRR